MIWPLLAVATVVTCELLRRLQILPQVRAVGARAGQASRLIANSGISDHWKERALPAYAGRMALASLRAFGRLVVAFAPFLVLAAAGPVFGIDVAALLLRWEVIVGISVAAAAYLFVRTRLGSAPAGGGYSGLDRTLHRLALASPARGELLFDLESAVAPAPSADATAGRHVFVTGLARAGTTTLMRAIHDSESFASLTYRDMPFVMAPNLWARLTRGSRRRMERTERAHGDGLLVDFDSPEALEEPFWRTFCGADYIRADALVPHRVDDEVVAKYQRFVAHVLARYGSARYLAKNNNGVLRIDALRRAFPKARVLIPFRAPLAQAASLQRQHRRFEDDGDPFTRDYMSWLAHHEFGRDHRPFVLDGRRPAATPASIDYWLSAWIIVYAHLLAAAERDRWGLIPIAYEDLCAEDGRLWPALCAEIGVWPGTPASFVRSGTTHEGEADDGLRAEADAVYARLRALSVERLNLPVTAQRRAAAS